MHIDKSDSPIILAVDTDDLEIAKRWVSITNPYIGVFKLGLEFFIKFGQAGVKAVQAETEKPLFLDLKLHDIPNTVSKSALQVADLAPMFLTVHASGGRAMIKAAAQSLPATKITAVTVLTSLDSADLKEVGMGKDAQDLAIQLAKLSVSAGAKAIVCSPKEISQIRNAVGDQVLIITPGVRPSGTLSSDDQKRTMDPKTAIAEGADYLVIGRPITKAVDISHAAKMILQEIKG
jgi:orotidine-5'-phosphate decarboxylase